MSSLEKINAEVSIYDLFDSSDPPVSYLTKNKPCQISCPFHGKDTHPSARVYPDSNSFRCFYCSKSWTPVTFWAESNKYFTDSGKLDISRAISDLEVRYNISSTTFDWQKKFYAIKKSSEAPKTFEVSERRALLDYYSWSVVSLIRKLPSDSRGEVAALVISIWKDLDNIDLLAESWELDLKSWYESAKLIVHA